MNTVFWKLNFGILSVFFKCFHIIITGKLLQHQFLGNKISESEGDFGNFQKYLSPKISRYTVLAMQLCQSLADVYFMYILCLILQLFKLLLLLLVKGKFSEFWRTNSSRSALLLAKVWNDLMCVSC